MEKFNKFLSQFKTLIFIQNFLNSMGSFYHKEVTLSVTNLRNDNFITYVNRNISKGIIDLNSCVIISMASSLRLHIYNGNWILGVFKAKKIILKRWIQVFVDYSIKDETCFISSGLYSNISTPSSEKDLRLTLQGELLNKIQILHMLWKSIRENVNKLQGNTLANIIPCDAIQTEMYLINAIPDHILYEKYIKSYFQTPKFVCVGDIIEINIPLAVSLGANRNTDQVVPSECLKFYIENVYGESLPGYGSFINSKSTKLLMSNKSTLPIRSPGRSLRSKNIEFLEKQVDIIVRYIRPCTLNNLSHNTQLGDSHAFSPAVISWCGVILLIGPSGSGKTDILNEAAGILGFSIKWLDAYSMRGDTSGATAGKITKAFRSCLPQTFLILTNITALENDKDGAIDSRAMEVLKEEMQQLNNENNSVFVFATAKSRDVSDEIWTLFTYHEICLPPDFDERKRILIWAVNFYTLDSVYTFDDRLLNDLSHRAGGFLLGDFKHFFSRIAVKLKESETANDNFRDICISIMTDMRSELSASLNLPKIPSVNWQDIGGLDQVKKELVDTIQLPILHPQLISSHLKRSGVLLYGPPGTGKTMLAKSVAHECGLNFLSVKGPELLDMYVGQSEANVREVFRKARQSSPCVIFFDELDSLAPSRGRSGDSGGVMDRIVSALLAELDDGDSSSNIFVLGATNRPDLLDPALLRPGRFDKQLFIDIARTKDERLKLLNAVFSKVPLHETVVLADVLDAIPDRLTGADFYSLALDSFYFAAERVIFDIEAGVAGEDAIVQVTEDDIRFVSKNIRPSVTVEQLKQYESLQIKFS